MGRLMKLFGQSSDLICEVKRIVAHPKWANAWLKLKPTMETGWLVETLYETINSIKISELFFC